MVTSGQGPDEGPGAADRPDHRERMASVIRPARSDVDVDGPADGRSRRRDRNRDAVIHAMLDLIREGDFNPATADIADRAGVSHRSVFRYFDDLGDLAREAISIEFAKALRLGAIVDVGEGPLGDRIDRLIEARLGVYDDTFAVSRVARFRAGAIPEVDFALSEISALERREIARHFRPELTQLDDDSRNRTTDAIVVLTDFPPYDTLRRHLGYDHERIAATWRHAISALFATDEAAR
jgi:TetR/AcrR family transcriptional regulator of autoinduction and epiphytic fitness